MITMPMFQWHTYYINQQHAGTILLSFPGRQIQTFCHEDAEAALHSGL